MHPAGERLDLQRFREVLLDPADRPRNPAQAAVPDRHLRQPPELLALQQPVTDAVATAEQVVADLQAQIDAYRELSSSLAFDEAELAGSGSQAADPRT